MKGIQYKVEILVGLNLIQLALAYIIRVQFLLLGRFFFFLNNFNKVKNSVSLQ